MDYQELIERLRFGNTISITNVAANAIESLLAENERLKAELTKYRDAPVVAYQHRDGMLSCRLPGGGVPGIDWVLLIIKPGEEK